MILKEPTYLSVFQAGWSGDSSVWKVQNRSELIISHTQMLWLQIDPMSSTDRRAQQQACSTLYLWILWPPFIMTITDYGSPPLLKE